MRDRAAGDKGGSENEWLFERDGGLCGHFICLCVELRHGGGVWWSPELMLTQHAHTHMRVHTHTHTETQTHKQATGTVEKAWRYWSEPLFRLSTESESNGEISPITPQGEPVHHYARTPLLTTTTTNIFNNQPALLWKIFFILESALHHIKKFKSSASESPTRCFCSRQPKRSQSFPPPFYTSKIFP